jgi:hypothetical protein
LADSSKKLARDDTFGCRRKDAFFCTSGRIRGRFRMISTIYYGTIGEVIKKFGEMVKKPTSVIQYKFMKGVDRADQYLSYCTILKKQ